MKILRPYQKNCIDSILRSLEESNSTLYVLPTGAGKTEIFCQVAREYVPRGKVLILAHRLELVEQAARRIQEIAKIEPAIEMGDRSSLNCGALFGPSSSVIIGSVQTQISRMEKFDPHKFSLVIIDECHHSTASTYRRIIEYYRQNKNLKILGCTATPDRADEEALGQIFETVAFEYTLETALKESWLVPIRQKLVYVHDLDFSHVRTTAGDLNGGDLDDVMNMERNLHEICTPAYELSKGRKTLIFAVSVRHGDQICEILNRHESGCAKFIHGKMKDEDRTQILQEYADGKFNFLINVMIATEGWDQPKVELIVMARPTKSRALYCQMIGRGTRPLCPIDDCIDASARREMIAASPKPYMEVLDFVGNAGCHKLQTLLDILGGNYSATEQKAVQARLAVELEAIDVAEALEMERIKKEIERQRQADWRRREAVVARANYSIREVSPFDVLDIEPAKDRGWDFGRKISERQRDFLIKAGISPDNLPYAQVRQILDDLIGRIRNKLCTYKQAKLLRRYGYNGKQTFEEAAKIMDDLKANGWKQGGGKAPLLIRKAIRDETNNGGVVAS